VRGGGQSSKEKTGILEMGCFNWQGRSKKEEKKKLLENGGKSARMGGTGEGANGEEQ